MYHCERQVRSVAEHFIVLHQHQGGAKVSEMLSTTIATNLSSPKTNSARAKEPPPLWEVSLFPQGPLRHRKVAEQRLWMAGPALGRLRQPGEWGWRPPFQSQVTDGLRAEQSRSQNVCEAVKVSQTVPHWDISTSLLLAGSSLTVLAAGFTWTKKSGARN